VQGILLVDTGSIDDICGISGALDARCKLEGLQEVLLVPFF
jgi:hypothetical protein